MKRIRAKVQHIYSFTSTFFLVFFLPFAFGRMAPQSVEHSSPSDVLSIAHAEAPSSCAGGDGGCCATGGAGAGAGGDGGSGGGSSAGGCCCGCDGCGAGCASGCCC